MKVLILETAEEAVERAAGIVADFVARRPAAVLGLATGGTMLPLYRRLAERHRTQGLSFAQTTTFNLDEYVGLPASHPCSYRAYMQEMLFDHIDIDLARTHLPSGDGADPSAEADRYEARIAASGGIDLQLLGIGRNGHIGFNEPTSSLASRTRIKTLTEETRRANQRYFASFEETPEHALTVGIGTILESRHCLLLATGSTKAEAAAWMIEGAISAACPASALQLHPQATVVLDQEAAARLKLRAYFDRVHPGGRENALR